MGKLGEARLSVLSWNDRCAAYWAAYKKLDSEDRAVADGMACELRDRVKENYHIQLSEAMALALVFETCVRSLFPHTQDPVIKEVKK